MEKNKTDVDIVIPVYGRFDLLAKCLEATPNAIQKFRYNIIIVDNKSPKETDGDPYKEIERMDHVIVIRNRENLGFPRAVNIGARRKQSPFIFFLNSDVILEPGAIDELLMDMMNDLTIGVAGSVLMFPDTPHGPKGKVQHVGLYTDIKTNVKHLYIGWDPKNPRVQSVREVLAVTGAALMIQRKVFMAVGGFDERYGMGTYEDVDICVAARMRKYKVVVNQFSRGTHFVGGSSSKYRVAFPTNSNHFLFVQKWQNSLPWTEYLHA